MQHKKNMYAAGDWAEIAVLINLLFPIQLMKPMFPAEALEEKDLGAAEPEDSNRLNSSNGIVARDVEVSKAKDTDEVLTESGIYLTNSNRVHVWVGEIDWAAGEPSDKTLHSGKIIFPARLEEDSAKEDLREVLVVDVWMRSEVERLSDHERAGKNMAKDKVGSSVEEGAEVPMKIRHLLHRINGAGAAAGGRIDKHLMSSGKIIHVRDYISVLEICKGLQTD